MSPGNSEHNTPCITVQQELLLKFHAQHPFLPDYPVTIFYELLIPQKHLVIKNVDEPFNVLGLQIINSPVTKTCLAYQ